MRSEPFAGYRTCGRPTIADQDYGDAVLPEDCPDYLESAPAMIVREEVAISYRDNGADAGTSVGMNVDAIVWPRWRPSSRSCGRCSTVVG